MLALGVAVGAAIGPGVGGADSRSRASASRSCCRRSLRSPGAAARTRRARPRARRRYSRRRSRPSRRRPLHPRARRRGRIERRHEDFDDSAGRRGDAGSGTERRQDAGQEHSESGAQAKLPPVTSVWLITLSGATFAQALAQTAAAPYIDSQLVPAGALLSDWSSLDASAFASEAGLLSGVPPQTLDAIVQPPCPEGAAGATCAPETAGAMTAADEFLKATLPAITASAAYREHGLVVITFGAVGNATASSLPAGSATATLSSEPPVGVLLLSPFARAGARPTTSFNPTSPSRASPGCCIDADPQARPYIRSS